MSKLNESNVTRLSNRKAIVNFSCPNIILHGLLKNGPYSKTKLRLGLKI